MTTRRSFLKVVAASGGALALGIRIAGAEEPGTPFVPNAWLRVDPDGSVLIRVGKTEMGQGVRTSLPMIVAEELDADFAKVRIEQASPGPDFRSLGTGGSGSIMRLWTPLREAGAAARAMLIAAAAARWEVSPAACEAREGVVIHPGSNRRLTYGELAADAAKQPVPEKVALKDPKAFRLLGTSQKRLDGVDIVTGRAQYGLDVRVPGMLYAVVARPPQLGAKADSFDATEAKKVAGVRHVVEISRGIAVVADDTWAAMRGRDALSIEWGESPFAAFDGDEHLKALEAATAAPGITIRKDGAGREAMQGVSRKIESVYLYPFAAHAPVEPVNCTALLADGRCTVWSPTQTPNAVQAAAARLCGIPAEAVKVNVMLLGGGFGRRLGVDFDREAIEVANRIEGTPIQLVWSRDDDMKHGYFQAASAHRMIAGLDENGRLVAWEHRKVSSPHNARGVPTEEDKKNPDTVRRWAWGVYDSPYAIPAAEMTYVPIDSPVPIGPWRSVFSPPSVFARECFLDEVAQQTRRDPLELRLALLGADDPSIENRYEIAGGGLDRARMRGVLELAAEKAGWGGRPAAGRSVGLAGNVFHTETYIAYVVEVSLRKSPRAGQLPFVVHRVVCAIDCGVAVNPNGIAQQVESGVIWSLSNMKGEITVREGRIQEGFYSDFPVVMIDETPGSIETHIVESDDPRPHGIGEPVVCPLAPAVANALSRLTGSRIRRLPVRASDLSA
ncbi:MAG TPA: molybdopterin cofactor-binding domain-containing protein [Thermoanaerobaculia bacterium]|nr:molybdopterin cofactor-binding domain-containing protein [Thermoanaerobaculia bacterium]